MICKNSQASIFKISDRKKHRGVAPVIATLLLVAISTVGGSMVFAYSQDAFSTSQISGTHTVEYLEFVGYDSRDVDRLLLHDENEILAKNCCGIADGKKNASERIVFYVQNHSVDSLIISELTFAGEVYSFSPSSKIGQWDKIGNGHAPNQNEFIIINQHKEGKNYETVEETSAIIESGELVTIMLSLNKEIKMNSDAQIKLTTINGNVFVSSLQMGQDLI